MVLLAANVVIIQGVDGVDDVGSEGDGGGGMNIHPPSLPLSPP